MPLALPPSEPTAAPYYNGGGLLNCLAFLICLEYWSRPRFVVTAPRYQAAAGDDTSVNDWKVPPDAPTDQSMHRTLPPLQMLHTRLTPPDDYF